MSDDRPAIVEQVALLAGVALLAVLLDQTLSIVSWWLLVALAVPLVGPLRRLVHSGGEDSDAAYATLATLGSAAIGVYVIAWTPAHWWVGLALHALVLVPMFHLDAGDASVPNPTRTVAGLLVVGVGLLGTTVSGSAWPGADGGVGSYLLAESPWTVWIPSLLVVLPLLGWYARHQGTVSPDPTTA